MTNDPNDTPEHRQYVADGGCPHIEGKVWCNGKAGHLGMHWATRADTDGSASRVWLLDARRVRGEP